MSRQPEIDQLARRTSASIAWCARNEPSIEFAATADDRAAAKCLQKRNLECHAERHLGAMSGAYHLCTDYLLTSDFDRRASASWSIRQTSRKFATSCVIAPAYGAGDTTRSFPRRRAHRNLGSLRRVGNGGLRAGNLHGATSSSSNLTCSLTRPKTQRRSLVCPLLA